MNRLWLSHLSDEELKKEMKSSLTTESTERVMARLAELLEKKRQGSYKERLAQQNYESPSWAHMQADQIGYERAMMEITELLNNRK